MWFAYQRPHRLNTVPQNPDTTPREYLGYIIENTDSMNFIDLNEYPPRH